MKRQTAIQIVGLSLLGLFLLSVVGCGGEGGGAITSLGKDEFKQKVVGMPPEEVVKWLGKPSHVDLHSEYGGRWLYRNACHDEVTGKELNAELDVGLKPGWEGNPGPPHVSAVSFASD